MSARRLWRLAAPLGVVVTIVAWFLRARPAPVPEVVLRPTPGPLPPVLAAGATQRRRSWHVVIQVAVLAAAITAWALGLRSVDPRDVGELGLVTVVPAQALAALAAVTLSFCLTLRGPRPATPLVVAHIGVMVLMLYGPGLLFDETHRFNVVWRHAGIVDHIIRTGEIDPRIDAYFNWPGFFILAALATEVGGFASTLEFSNWTPVVFNLLYLPPLVLIARTATSDERLVWLSVWVFYLTNWIGQDYFSPQGIGLFTYFVVLAALLTWFRGEGRAARLLPRIRRSRLLSSLTGARLLARVRRGRAPASAPPAPSAVPAQGARAAALMGIIVACIAVQVPSHQLTPFAILLALVALVAVRGTVARGLPVVTAVVIVAWLSYMTIAYLAGNIEALTGKVGQVNDTATSNVGDRVAGSADHVTVVQLRLLESAGLWLLAGVGALLRRRQGHRDAAIAALAAAPFVLAVLQPYGGEMLLRVYLFALPFVAFFVAAALHRPRPGTSSWWQTALLVCVSVGLIGLFGFTRYGNERVSLFTKEEVATIEQLYELAPPGSLLVAASPHLPWQGRNYAAYDYELLSRLNKTDLVPAEEQPRTFTDAIAQEMAERRRVLAFLVLTRSQRNYDKLFGSASWGSITALDRELAGTQRFQKVFDNGDGQIYRLVGPERKPST